MNLDIGANRHIDESRVPEDLLALVPYVKKWAYERNTNQDQFVSRMLRERPEEVSQFKAICDEHRKIFHEWLATIPPKHMADMTDSDWSHPHFAFTSMYKVRDLLPLEEHEVTDEIRKVKRRLQEEWRLEQYRQAINEAEAAFRRRDYASYVELLDPYRDLLNGSSEKKFNFARNRRDRANESNASDPADGATDL